MSVIFPSVNIEKNLIQHSQRGSVICFNIRHAIIECVGKVKEKKISEGKF